MCILAFTQCCDYTLRGASVYTCILDILSRQRRTWRVALFVAALVELYDGLDL